MFQKRFFIDYGLGLHLGLVVALAPELKLALFTAGLSPIYLSFNWNITDNVTAICALIPFPLGLGAMMLDNDFLPVSVNDSFEIGVKIKM